MPKIKMPEPWKKGSRKGTFERLCEIGTLVFEPSRELFFLRVARGASSLSFDDWGPWSGVLEDEQSVMLEAGVWHAELVRSGWTTMEYRDFADPNVGKEASTALMLSVLTRMKRSPLIPRTLCHQLDSDRARRRKSVSDGVLRTAASDFHCEALGSAWEGGPFATLWLTIQKPGMPKRAEGGRRVEFDVHQLDAFIDYLAAYRGRMVEMETLTGILNPDAAFAEGIDARAAHATRLAHMQGVAAVLDELSRSTPENMATILAMAQMINAGDMTAEIYYPPGEEFTGPVH